MKILSLCLALGVLSSCASTVDWPMSHFHSSETNGRARLRIEGGLQAQNSVVLTDDYTLTAPNAETPRVDRTLDFLVGGNVGILDRWDIGLRLPGYAFTKFQFIGSPRSESAIRSFSLSAVAAVAGSGSKQSGDSWIGSTRYNVDKHDRMGELSLVGGYRTSEALLVYLAPYAQAGSYEGSWTRTPLSGTTTINNFNGHIKNRGFNLGLVLTGANRIDILFELGTGWTKTGQVHNRQWGGALMVNILLYQPAPASVPIESKPSAPTPDEV